MERGFDMFTRRGRFKRNYLKIDTKARMALYDIRNLPDAYVFT